MCIVRTCYHAAQWEVYDVRMDESLQVLASHAVAGWED
jgi:hypothetical protein